MCDMFRARLHYSVGCTGGIKCPHFPILRDEGIAYLKAGMLDSFGGLAPNELDALATEVESLLIGGLR